MTDPNWSQRIQQPEVSVQTEDFYRENPPTRRIIHECVIYFPQHYISETRTLNFQYKYHVIGFGWFMGYLLLLFLDCFQPKCQSGQSNLIGVLNPHFKPPILLTFFNKIE